MPTSAPTTPQPAQVTQYVTTIINQQVIVLVQVFTIVIEPFVPTQTFTSVVTTTVTPVSTPGQPAPTPITTTLTQVVTITVGPTGTGIVGGTGIVVPIASPTAPTTPTTITTTIVQPTIVIAPIGGPASTVTFADGQVVTIQPGAPATTVFVTLTRTVTQAGLPTYTSTVYVTAGGQGNNNAAPTPVGNSVCTKTYTVQSGDICYTILDRVGGITLQQLYALNPAINSGCTNLQPGQVLCVGASSPAPAPITTTYTTVYTTAVVLVQPVINVYIVNVYAIVDLIGSTSISTQYSTQTVYQTQTVISTLTATVTTTVTPSVSATPSQSGNGAVQPGQNSLTSSATHSSTSVSPSSIPSSAANGTINNGGVGVNGTSNSTLERRHIAYHVKRNRRVLIH